MDAESSRHDNLESIFEGASSEPRTLPLEYLRNITNDFSEELLLGEGGFGKVYKVKLPDTFHSHKCMYRYTFIYPEIRIGINKPL
jgi:hypothetical protein